jgi:hypothetical protein
MNNKYLKKMKQLLLIATMLLTFGFADAQTKIYSADGNYKGKLKYVIEGSNIMQMEITKVNLHL